MATDPTLRDLSGNINSGTAVVLTGARITYSTSNFIMTPDGPSNTPTYSTAPVAVDFMGRSNNKIVIDGSYNANDNVSNGVTVELIQQFAADTNGQIYFKDDIFATGTNGKLVQVNSWKVERDARDSECGSIIRYTIELIETK